MYTDFCEIIPGLLLGSVNDVDDMVRAGADVLVPLAFMHGSIWNTGFRGEIIYCPITDMSVLPDDVLYLLVEMISRRLDSCKKVTCHVLAEHDTSLDHLDSLNFFSRNKIRSHQLHITCLHSSEYIKIRRNEDVILLVIRQNAKSGR